MSKSNKAERKHMARVAEIPCVACSKMGVITPQVQLHHIRAGAGMGQRSSHYHVIPLCFQHHIGGGHGIAFHAGRRVWTQKFGTEQELLDMVNELLE